MGLSIELEQLASRETRKSVADSGIRRFAVNAIQEQRDENTGVANKLWDGFSRFTGSLVSKVLSTVTTVSKFTLTLLWQLTTTTVGFIWNFNWNQSDSEIDQYINNAFAGLGGILGGTLGNALGWLTCGALPGAVIFSFNEAMGLYVLERVGEEALEEIASNVANLIRYTSMSLIRVGIAFLYKNIRRLWRQTDSAFKQNLINSGASKEKIDKALEERNKPWSFAQKTEDFIESLPDGFIENFVEELFEEFTDSCVEAGYVVANSVDSFLLMQQQAMNNVLGEEKTVEITLNRDAENVSDG